MEGKLFFIDRGAHVTVRNSQGTVAAFESIDLFYRYYTDKLDLSGEYYVDYEPDKTLLYKSAKGNFEPLSNQWAGPIPEYEEVIEDVENMRAKLDDPYFSLSLEEARAYKLDRLKQSTFAAITAHMPGWKQVKQKEYIALYEKVLNGHKLTPLEQAVYERFPGNKRSPEECYNDCIAAARWIMECVAQHDKKEKEVEKARSLKSIRGVKDPDYPRWNQWEG
jgi:hypothetical protein